MSIGELEKALDARSDAPVGRTDLLKALDLMAGDGQVSVARNRAVTFL